MKLELYLVRHGIAADTSPDGSDDGRPLTTAGIADLEDEATALGMLKVRFDVIFTSPLVRARQTAEVLGAHLGGKPPVTIMPALAPPGSPSEVLTALRKQGSTLGQVALVGHEPNMGALAAFCLGTHAAFPFKKGGVCRIDFELPWPTGPASARSPGLPGGPGALRWFATPKMLLAIARSRA